MTRPPVPPPNASNRAVRAYLVQFLLLLNSSRTQNEASEMAEKIVGDGEALYEFSMKEWTDVFGIEGKLIYNELQRSKYGYVS